MMPFEIVGAWVRGLSSLVFLILGPYLIYCWYEDAHAWRPVATGYTTAPTTAANDVPTRAPAPSEWVLAPNWGFNRQTAILAMGLAMSLWAFPKGPALSITRLLRRKGTDEPHPIRNGEIRQLIRPDGTQLRVEMYGPPDAQPIVLTHGWGLDSDAWYYAKRHLSMFRLIVWDLPGFGNSQQPASHDFSLDKLAEDLDAVIDVAGGRPVVLMGHSIGGMISLTHFKLFPAAVPTRVCGLVLVNTTYTNPVRTTSMATLKMAIQKPVFEPLLYLTIGLSPLMRVMNVLSYLNGSAHRSAESSGFSGKETRGQLDSVARYTPRISPAIVARGMLGMLKYDATTTLRTINVPTLVITGDRDATCKPEASKHMRSEIPAAELATFAPAKHQGLLEHHGEFVETVAAFVRRCGVGSRQPRLDG